MNPKTRTPSGHRRTNVRSHVRKMRNGRYQNVRAHGKTIADAHRQTQAATLARRALIQRMRQCPQCGEQMTPLYGRKVLRCPRCYHEQSYQKR